MLDRRRVILERAKSPDANCSAKAREMIGRHAAHKRQPRQRRPLVFPGMAQHDVRDLPIGELAAIYRGIAKHFGKRRAPKRMAERRLRVHRKLQHRIVERVAWQRFWERKGQQVLMAADASEQALGFAKELSSAELLVLINVDELRKPDAPERPARARIAAPAQHAEKP